MSILSLPSPNYDDRPDGASISMLVMHYTGMQTAEAALHRLVAPESKVSAHYVIDEDGAIYQLVPEEKRAWHAGVSYWQGRERLNDVSIGIEIVNPGHEFGYRPFPFMQMKSVLSLSKEIVTSYDILPWNVVGHSDIAPTRKTDPGELFDWEFLAHHGVGLWPSIIADTATIPLLQEGDHGPEVRHMQERLAYYGYQVPTDGIYESKTLGTVEAFKRHFCPHAFNSTWDRYANAVLNALLDMMK